MISLGAFLLMKTDGKKCRRLLKLRFLQVKAVISQPGMELRA